MILMTPTRMRVLQVYMEYRRREGFSPSEREAARVLGVSQATIRHHLKILKEAGMVAKSKLIARGVTVTHRGVRLAASG